jgi:4-carboxymuconolactone decarboxylase
MEEKSRYELGLQQRRAVLGDAHVDHALSHGTEFSADFQEMVTRYSWGEVWARPELDRNTRSLVAIATMIALNRADDFKAHVRAALRLGTSPEQIREVLLQSAIYCGVSAADSAFRATEAVMAEESAHQH